MNKHCILVVQRVNTQTTLRVNQHFTLNVVRINASIYTHVSNNGNNKIVQYLRLHENAIPVSQTP